MNYTSKFYSHKGKGFYHWRVRHSHQRFKYIGFKRYGVREPDIPIPNGNTWKSHAEYSDYFSKPRVKLYK